MGAHIIEKDGEGGCSFASSPWALHDFVSTLYTSEGRSAHVPIGRTRATPVHKKSPHSDKSAQMVNLYYKVVEYS